ncbi:hypothetical protein N24_1854 [Corynebacterium suranareeae]|uniref:VWA-like domain-containing protein n=2 Tax=Corynebacterium suranareeae TaxID=2506452 RepID=A0A160PR52_9CORY|nr:hypothetical protein N24_1854 [Corynebacterium suranareeae]
MRLPAWSRQKFNIHAPVPLLTLVVESDPPMVTFSVSNHAPHTFSPFDIQPPLTGNSTTGEHGYEYTAVLEKLATNHLFTPINPQHPATITVTDSGSTIDLDAAALAQHLALAITSDSLLANHQDHNRDMMDLLSQLTHHVGFDRRFIVDQLFVSQALKTHRLPAPANNVIYTVANDVIPSAKDILSITAKMNNPLTATTRAPVTTDEVHAAYDVFFASLASVFFPCTYGAVFLNNAEFIKFVDYLIAEATTLHTASIISTDTFNQFQSMRNITIDDLTAEFLLRKDEHDTTDDYSFPRTLISLLHSWVYHNHSNAQTNNNAPTCTLTPFSVTQWIMPETIVFINAEAHAHASSQDIEKKWKEINAALTGSIRIMSPNAISKLQSAQHLGVQAQMQALRARKNHQTAQKRAAQENDFSQALPSPQTIVLSVADVLSKLTHVRQSQNPQKYQKKTLTRASRRHPDNPNVSGTVKSKRFYPDLHVYVDTSGSISEESYRNSVVLLMQLATKLDINLYFSTFSHVLSQEILLPTKGKSVQQLTALISAIPKVSGGTDYHQIWDYIQTNPQRQERMNLVLTDFGFMPNRGLNIDHPNSMFYVPILPDYGSWSMVRRDMTDFANAMVDFDPYIHSRLLGVHGK